MSCEQEANLLIAKLIELFRGHRRYDSLLPNPYSLTAFVCIAFPFPVEHNQARSSGKAAGIRPVV